MVDSERRETAKLIVINICAVALLLVAGFFTVRAARHYASEAAGKIKTSDVIHRVWDSELYPETSKPIFWIDESTILVAANKGPKPRSGEEMRARESWLYVWRLGEKPIPHGGSPKEASSGYYCAANGSVTFPQKTEAGVQISRIGPPGQERDAAPRYLSNVGAPRNDRERIEPSDCEMYSDPSMSGIGYVTDSERKHYLVFGKNVGPADSNEKLVLMRADGSDRVTLPISRGEISGPGYRMFDRAFLIYQGYLSGVGGDPKLPHGHFAVWRDTNCLAVWRVEPESGKQDRFCVPFGTWAGDPAVLGDALLSLVPTSAGYFFSYRRTHGTSGLYLFKDQSVRLVLSGRVNRLVVSPSGCRLALEYVPNDDAYRMGSLSSPTIAAIDVC